MAGGFLSVVQFMDEVIGVAGAITAYVSHRNESKLAMDLVKYAFSAIEDVVGDVPDELEEKIKTVVGSAVDVIGDVVKRL